MSDETDGTRSRVRYRFPPLERRGVIAGWRAGQVASVAAGLVLAVLSVRSRPTLPGVLVAVTWVGGAVALAFWPIAGRTGEQWLPVVVRWGWAGATGNRVVAERGDRGRAPWPSSDRVDGPPVGRFPTPDRARTRSSTGSASGRDRRDPTVRGSVSWRTSGPGP